MSLNNAMVFGSYEARVVSNSVLSGEIGSFAFLRSGSSVGNAQPIGSLPNSGILQRIAAIVDAIVLYGIAPSACRMI